MSSALSLRELVIAVDGPAASGKSSVSRALARLLNATYVNSGSFYRAITLLAISLPNPDLLISELEKNRIDSRIENRQALVLLDGRLLTEDELSAPAVNANVSHFSALPEVRQWLLGRLRAFAGHGPLIMEGRDIGTVVFPSAHFKFYLDANPAIRAARRRAQGIRDSISSRDAQDASRKEAPLATAPDACVIDSTGLTLEEVVQKIHSIIVGSGFSLHESASSVHESHV
jgi:cytidylate kinase